MKYLLVEDNHELANAICSRIKLDGHVIDHTDKLEDAIAELKNSDIKNKIIW